MKPLGKCTPVDHASRRMFLKGTLSTAGGAAVANWGGLFNSEMIAAEAQKRNKKQAILLWMAGGASHLETFDMKTGAPNGGPFRPISTNVPGLQICEYLPNLAQQADKLAVIRSMSTEPSTAAGHANATYLMHTGYLKDTISRHPEFGAVAAKFLGDENAKLPSFIQMSGGGESTPLGTPGYLGAAYQPLRMNMTNPRPENVESYLSPELESRRRNLFRQFEQGFQREHHATAYDIFRSSREKAWRLMEAKGVFDYEEDWKKTGDLYGHSFFGRNCMIARRLIEAGVPFVEVEQQNYDTHQNNFSGHKSLLPVLDKAWAGLMTDLEQRGLLETTLIVWMGEMGRTPSINPSNGRDHFVRAWTTVLAGGPVKGGSVYGKTDGDGAVVQEGKMNEGDFFATVYTALGIDPNEEIYSGIRPIPLAASGSRVVKEILA